MRVFNYQEHQTRGQSQGRAAGAQRYAPTFTLTLPRLDPTVPLKLQLLREGPNRSWAHLLKEMAIADALSTKDLAKGAKGKLGIEELAAIGFRNFINTTLGGLNCLDLTIALHESGGNLGDNWSGQAVGEQAIVRDGIDPARGHLFLVIGEAGSNATRARRIMQPVFDRVIKIQSGRKLYMTAYKAMLDMSNRVAPILNPWEAHGLAVHHYWRGCNNEKDYLEELREELGDETDDIDVEYTMAEMKQSFDWTCDFPSKSKCLSNKTLRSLARQTDNREAQRLAQTTLAALEILSAGEEKFPLILGLDVTPINYASIVHWREDDDIYRIADDFINAEYEASDYTEHLGVAAYQIDSPVNASAFVETIRRYCNALKALDALIEAMTEVEPTE